MWPGETTLNLTLPRRGSKLSVDSLQINEISCMAGGEPCDEYLVIAIKWRDGQSGWGGNHVLTLPRRGLQANFCYTVLYVHSFTLHSYYIILKEPCQVDIVFDHKKKAVSMVFLKN